MTSPWLELDADTCCACGACAAVCRTGALDFDLRSRAFRAECRAAASGEAPLLTVCCREADPELAGGAACVLPCRGGLSASDLLAAAAVGVERVDLISGECETCPDRVAKAALDHAVSTAGETLAALRRCLDITRGCRPGQGSAAAAAPTVSRRGLFRYLARGVGQAASSGTSPTHPERSIGTLHRHVAAPASHRRLILDLSELQAGATTPL